MVDGQIVPSDIVTVVDKEIVGMGELSEVVDMVEDDLEAVQVVGLVEERVVQS